MKLARFRVMNFRSVSNSGWIEADAVTALVGTNESGKTNLLLPLWKLNPANEGEINLLDDCPRSLYPKIRDSKVMPYFVEAVFEVPEPLAKELSRLSGSNVGNFQEVMVARRYSAEYRVTFPGAEQIRAIKAGNLNAVLTSAKDDLATISEMKSESGHKNSIIAAIEACMVEDPVGEVGAKELARVREALGAAQPANSPKSSSLLPRLLRACEEVEDLHSSVTLPDPAENVDVRKLVLQSIPKFVYYSNYGNLDSDIYLPHVIDNMKRSDVGQKDRAKARTLKVLFDFVTLSPQEILELGQPLSEKLGRPPTPKEVEEHDQAAKERYILLTGASAHLTDAFRKWWKQGEYIFRFSADGPQFRIWVSDDRRPDPVDLEGRSTGLQWFLSFFLVFLVESGDEHSGSILLLDEPGHSLHPSAQKDLSEFFEALSEQNQLLYTTHSPFLVDTDHLDRARKVYVDKGGKTKATADLRGEEDDSEDRGSSYAVYAAVGISVAESVLLGCDPVVVEGVSDQHMLTAMKTLLIAAGRIQPLRELVFSPAGGVRGVKALSTVLGTRGDRLPPVFLDSDQAGRELGLALSRELYSGDSERILYAGDFAGFPDAESEDLIPTEVLVREVDRLIRDPEDAFEDIAVAGQPIVPQIKAWASSAGVTLETGWKVELSRRVKKALLANGPDGVRPADLDRWEKLFAALEAAV